MYNGIHITHGRFLSLAGKAFDVALDITLAFAFLAGSVVGVLLLDAVLDFWR